MWDRMAWKEREGKNSKSEWYIFLLAFLFNVACVIALVFFSTSACYRAAKTAVRENREIQSVYGKIESCGWMVTGNMEEYSGGDSSRGFAQLNFVIKGTRKQGYITVTMIKKDKAWELADVEY